GEWGSTRCPSPARTGRVKYRLWLRVDIRYCFTVGFSWGSRIEATMVKSLRYVANAVCNGGSSAPSATTRHQNRRLPTGSDKSGETTRISTSGSCSAHRVQEVPSASRIDGSSSAGGVEGIDS